MEKTENIPTVRGNHFNNIQPGTFRMDWIGGPERLQEIQKLMDDLEPSLDACPFCDAPATIEGKWTFNAPGVLVRCSSCGCRTSLKIKGLDISTRRDWTLEECAAEAAAQWNRRAAI